MTQGHDTAMQSNNTARALGAQALGAQAGARRALGHDTGTRGGAWRRRAARGRAGARAALRHGSLGLRQDRLGCHDTASWGLGHGAGLATKHPRTGGLGAAWAHWLGQIGCLVHLTHFDSVFGLSTVPESLIGHCS